MEGPAKPRFSLPKEEVLGFEVKSVLLKEKMKRNGAFWRGPAKPRLPPTSRRNLNQTSDAAASIDTGIAEIGEALLASMDTRH